MVVSLTDAVNFPTTFTLISGAECSERQVRTRLFSKPSASNQKVENPPHSLTSAAGIISHRTICKMEHSVYIKNNPFVARACGIESSNLIPHKATFTRFLLRGSRVTGSLLTR